MNSYQESSSRDLDEGESQNQSIAADKGSLTRSLRAAVQSAQILANYYDNVGKQLELLIAQVEHTK